jgi:hypothetical protein
MRTTLRVMMSMFMLLYGAGFSVPTDTISRLFVI